MARADYHVFGLGLGADDLRYVGWTRRSLRDEQDQIVSDLAGSGGRDIAAWIAQAVGRGTISLFEIESAPSLEDARSTAESLCRYFQSLGLDVTPAEAGDVAVQVAPCRRPRSQAQGAERRSLHAEDPRVPA